MTVTKYKFKTCRECRHYHNLKKCRHCMRFHDDLFEGGELPSDFLDEWQRIYALYQPEVEK